MSQMVTEGFSEKKKVLVYFCIYVFCSLRDVLITCPTTTYKMQPTAAKQTRQNPENQYWYTGIHISAGLKQNNPWPRI